MLEFRKYKNIAGIYKWENIINHKCYIGQTINLYSRIKDHVRRMRHASKNDKCLLYRAVAKYGIQYFDLLILEVIPNTEALKLILDEKEKFYIQMYSSFGNGYNMTEGGGGGCLGYKFNTEQIENCKRAAKESAKRRTKQVFLYNIETKEVCRFNSITEASRIMQVGHSRVEHCCMHKTWLCCKKYLGAFSENDLLIRVLEYYKYLPFKNVCTKSINNRGKIKSKTHSHKEETKKKISFGNSKYKVIIHDTVDDAFITFETVKEAAYFFNVTPCCFLHHCKNGMGRTRLYRDKYYILLINKKNGIKI